MPRSPLGGVSGRPWGEAEPACRGAPARELVCVLRIRSGAAARRSDFFCAWLLCGSQRAIRTFPPSQRAVGCSPAPRGGEVSGSCEGRAEARGSAPGQVSERGLCGGEGVVRGAVRRPSAALRWRPLSGELRGFNSAVRASDVRFCFRLSLLTPSCRPASFTCAGRIVALVACSLSQFQLLALWSQRCKIPEGNRVPGLVVRGRGCHCSLGCPLVVPCGLQVLFECSQLPCQI